MSMVLGRNTRGRRLAAQLFVWVSLAIVLYPLLRMLLFLRCSIRVSSGWTPGPG